MRWAIAQCARFDEAASIKNKAARLEAYARIRDDVESQRQFAEIKLRACVKIGEISRDLEKAGNQYAFPPMGRAKNNNSPKLGSRPVLLIGMKNSLEVGRNRRCK